MKARPTLFASTLCILGCSPAPAAPLRYPQLPQAGEAHAARPTLEPASELTPLALACRTDEPALENALDDDCDGRIDGAPEDAPLIVAIAFPRSAPVALSLVRDQAEPIALEAHACDEARTFCTAQIASSALARGRYTLIAQATAPAERHPVLVSVQAHGKVTAYIADLGSLDQEPRALGKLALP